MKTAAFVLFELLIVLLIVGVVYSLSMTQFPDPSSLTEESVYRLKKELKKYQGDRESTVALACFDEETVNCIIEVDGELVTQTFEVPDDFKMYTFDRFGFERELFERHDYFERKYQLPLLFSFFLYPNGSSTESVVELNDRYYTYHAFLGEVRIFEEYSDAKTALLSEDLKSSFLVQR